MNVSLHVQMGNGVLSHLPVHYEINTKISNVALLQSVIYDIFLLNGKSLGGPGSITLIINGGSPKYYKGPQKKENNT
jgi:hypothetical protein